MARFHASAALLRAGTANGHAKAIATQSYLERVAAEPWIRIVVPSLLSIFLTAAWVGSAYKHFYDRSAVIANSMLDLEHVSALTAIDLQIATDATTGVAPSYATALRMAIPPHGLEGGRQAYVTSGDGRIAAAEPSEHLGKSLDDILGLAQPLTAMADRAGVMRINLANGTDALASVRTIEGRRSQLAFVQPVADILAPWRQQLVTKIILLTSTTIVVAMLCIAFLTQLSRARQADDICTELRRRTEMVLASGRSGLWDWDVARGRIYWSDSMFMLLGRDRKSEFMSFGDIANLMHPADANLFTAANDLVLQSDARIDNEFRLRHADGSWIWLRARGEKVADPTSGATHLVGIAVDISEQKALDASRNTADMRVRDAIEGISEAFALFDSDQRLVAANSKYQSLFALSADVLKPGASRAQIEKVGRLATLHTESPSSDSPDNGSRSYELRLNDGRWLQVNERGTKDGGYVYVGSDITAHKVYESSLASHNEVLESMVEHLERSRLTLQERSRRLSELNDRYLVQKAEAEGANRAKAEFLANMNHELRTPLNHIINFAGMMEAQMFGPLGHERYKEYAGDIARSGEYLLGVVSDILDMASIEAGRVHLERERVALADICEEARLKHQPLGDNRNVSIRIRVDGPLHVIGDRKSLSQIIDNMVRNAVKYTRNGSEVGVRAKRQGDAIQLFFEDNGAGIADDMIERMGRPFEQTGSVIENGYKGSGLGFSISKSLAELHGGGIRIRSKLGEGTVVMVSLPVDGPASMIRDRDAA
jgi:two-component system, cell cycle sensor histidine kinase PleC